MLNPAIEKTVQAFSAPTPDDESRNIIDRVAEFVAKNGLEFEERTRENQYGNPRFAFLFGGEFAEYYQFRLMQEMQKKEEVGMHVPPRLVAPLPNIIQTAPQLDASVALTQIATLTQQIADSEANLRAQFDSIEMQKEAQLVVAIENAEACKISSICEQVSLDIEPLSKLLDQLCGHCSKDVISNCKKWIFEKCTTDRLREAILMYLLYRVKEPRAAEQLKLHILYLINDWAHHCQRKKLDAIRQMLSRYVPQLYAFTAQGVKDAAVNEKLEKLIGVWEGHKYFDDGCYKQLRNPLLLYQNWKNAQQAEYAKKGAEIHAQLLGTYKGYEKQHQDFALHCRAQITILQQQIEARRMPQPLTSLLSTGDPSIEMQMQPMNRRERRSRFDQKIPPTLPESDGGKSDYGRFFTTPPPHTNVPSPKDIYHARPDEDDPSYIVYDEIEYDSGNNDRNQENKSPNRKPPFQVLPKPPSFTPMQEAFDDASLIPNCPYYDLPAGMMMPLIDMNDVLYKPVTISKLRLPPPLPPSERLLRAIDAYYATPGPDNPRDADGWERLGLFDYFAKKSEIKKILEDKLKAEGKTLESVIENVYTEDEKIDLKNEDGNNATVRHHSPSRSRHQSSSNESTSSDSSSSSQSIQKESRKSRKSSSSSSSRSSTRSRSRSRRRCRKSGSSTPKEREASKSRSRSPVARSSFMEWSKTHGSRSPTPTLVPQSVPPSRLDSNNKGALLLARMGWQGGGLGADKQGIEDPISGGEVRDAADQYRGVGSKPDMYEEYRKQMSGYHRNKNRRLD